MRPEAGNSWSVLIFFIYAVFLFSMASM